MRKIIWILIFGIWIFNLGCGGSDTVSSIVVSPANPSVGMGKTQQFSAAAYNAGGTIISAAFNWSVSGSGGTIDSNGLFTAGSSVGTCDVAASSGGASGTSRVNVVSSGSVSGTVKNSSGTGISGIYVYLTCAPSLAATSGSSGVYTISNVPPATYEVRTRENILYISTTAEATVTTGEAASANIALRDRFSITSQTITSSSVTGYITNNGTTEAPGVTITYTFSDGGTYVGGGGTTIGTLISGETEFFSVLVIPNVSSYTASTRDIAYSY